MHYSHLILFFCLVSLIKKTSAQSSLISEATDEGLLTENYLTMTSSCPPRVIIYNRRSEIHAYHKEAGTKVSMKFINNATGNFCDLIGVETRVTNFYSSCTRKYICCENEKRLWVTKFC